MKMNLVIKVTSFALILAFPSIAMADIPKQKIDALSDSEKSTLEAEIVIAKILNASETGNEHYSRALDEDLSQYTVDELDEMKGYIENGADSDHVEITGYDELFSSEQRASFLVYNAVSDIGGQLDFVGQNHNPELFFGDSLQEIESAHIYLTYFGDCSYEEVRATLEEYTDEFLYSIPLSFPNVTFEIMDICWKVPSIDEDDMYGATYWCENKDGVFERGDGQGIIYY